MPAGALQVLAAVGFGFAEMRRGPAFFCVALALYSASLMLYGRYFARQ
jgi:hypothetical protein